MPSIETSSINDSTVSASSWTGFGSCIVYSFLLSGLAERRHINGTRGQKARLLAPLLISTTVSGQTRLPVGRPPTTTHEAIEAVAFELFEEQGFDETTVEEIAEAAGVGRRTLFRYFPSKFDIPWGKFDQSLEIFDGTLAAIPEEVRVWQAVQRGVVQFNTFDATVISQHRARMTLILRTPALQAHSVLMYQRWRNVIANFVADRYHMASSDLLPRTVGHVSLALALSAYEQWLQSQSSSLENLLEEAMSALRLYLADE